MASNRTKNVIKNSAASLIYKIVHMFVQFVMRTAFIYFLGNEYTGISGLFTDILQVLSVMELGLDSSMVYALYKPLVHKDEKRISALLLFYKKAFFVIGIMVLVGGAALLPFLDNIVHDVPNISENIKGIFLIYVMTSAFSYLLIYRVVLLRADQQSRIISNWNSLVDLAECLIEVVLVALLRNFYAYLGVRFIAAIMRNVLLSIITVRRYPNFFNNSLERLPKEEKKTLFRDLSCITIYNLSGVVINSTDSIFISVFAGTVQVAVIGNFTLIINSVSTAIGQVVNASKASIGNLAATSSKDKQEKIFNRMNFALFWIACVVCTCFISLLNLFVGSIWFEESYKIAESIIAVMVINFFIAIMVLPVESFRTANGIFAQGWYRPAIMAILNILLDIYMGSRWGIMGIFLATSISRVLTQVWFDPYLVYKLVFKKSVKDYYIKYVIYVLVTVLSCITAAILCHAVHVTNRFIDFAGRMLIAGIIPNIYICIFFHGTEEFTYYRKILRKLWRVM